MALGKRDRLYGHAAIVFFTAVTFLGLANCDAQTTDDLHQLLASGKVFGLREAVQQTAAPVLYRGAVASSLNHIEEAANDLREVIRANPGSEDAYQARELLANTYYRNGLYREAFEELNAAIQERPKSEDLQNAKPLLEAYARAGDMTVMSLHPTNLRGIHSCQLPMRINGRRSDTLAFDTGADVSFISDREAAYLGLTSVAVSTKLTDSSGNGVNGIRVAIAKDVTIGGLHLKHVPFFVIPDANEPFVTFGPKEMHRGLIGLPILLAMRSIRWTPEGDFEFDFPSTASAKTSNLLFHDRNPIVQVMAGGHDLDFTLDTGAINTDLNPLFAEAFPALIASGKKEAHVITGIGGSKNYESVLLPSVSLTVGGKAVILAPAHVSVAEGLGGIGMWAGNLGNDLLNQATAIVIDFRAMSLKLE